MRLAELCDFVNGNGFKPEQWRSQGLPIIRIQNLNGSTDFNYYDGAVRDRWIVEPGVILFAWAGVKGVSFGPCIWPGPKGVLNQHIFRVEPKEQVDLYWLYGALKLVTSRIEAKAHGFKASLLHVQRGEVTDQIIDVPTLDEQRRIGQLLRTWDEAIEKMERLIAAKASSFDHWSSALLTGRRQLERKRLNWRSAALTDVTIEASARNREGKLDANTVMGVNKLHGMIPMKDHVRAADLSRYKIVRPGAFAYNPMRLNIGSIAQNNHGRDVLVSPDYVAFEALSASLMPAYFDHLRRTPMWGRFVKTAGSGGVRVRIYYDDLSDFTFELPPVDEQARIVEVLDTGRREIAILERQRDALAKQKSGLMQKLLTGEWSVRVAESQEAAE